MVSEWEESTEPATITFLPGRECKRDTCEKEPDRGKDYCSRKCWRADNPEVAL